MMQKQKDKCYMISLTVARVKFIEPENRIVLIRIWVKVEYQKCQSKDTREKFIRFIT
jgi:hypothetical protein